jgi:hypothetical protein
MPRRKQAANRVCGEEAVSDAAQNRFAEPAGSADHNQLASILGATPDQLACNRV